VRKSAGARGVAAERSVSLMTYTYTICLRQSSGDPGFVSESARHR
jgi:hypothetical protein